MKNIYLITEDGERSCIAARTMAEAVNIDPNFTQRETEFYHQNILQSCEFIGELKNE